MKNTIKAKIWFLIALLGIAIVGKSQTIYFPNGASGIGTSKNGNVGIGTNNTPSQNLDVNGIIRTTHAEFYEGTTWCGFIGRGGSYTGGWSAIPTALTLTYAGRDFAIGGWRKSDGKWNGASLFINSDNNYVGIGTITPSSKFEIFNSAQSGHLLLSTDDAPEADNTRIDIDFRVNNRQHTVARLASFYESSSNGGYGGLRFYTRNAGNLSEVMRLSSNGNVGIGTPTPKNALDVNGTIHAREVKVDLIGWADFVFTPTYKLRPLSEVEQFIKTNGHLPEIPKAEEVQQNGVNLGEMQTKLLQKVEELTLYILELKKENEFMKKEIENLKNKPNEKLIYSYAEN